MKLAQGHASAGGGAEVVLSSCLLPPSLAPLPSSLLSSPHATTPQTRLLPRRSGILRMLLLAILTKMPKEAPKRPAPTVMVACVRGREEKERGEKAKPN